MKKLLIELVSALKKAEEMRLPHHVETAVKYSLFKNFALIYKLGEVSCNNGGEMVLNPKLQREIFESLDSAKEPTVEIRIDTHSDILEQIRGQL